MSEKSTCPLGAHRIQVEKNSRKSINQYNFFNGQRVKQLFLPKGAGIGCAEKVILRDLSCYKTNRTRASSVQGLMDAVWWEHRVCWGKR